jgi:hypothetical protein
VWMLSKKSRCAAVARALKFNEIMSTRALCQAVEMSRQNHYKQVKARTRREIDEELIGQQVKKKAFRRNLWGDLFEVRHNLLKTRKIARLNAWDI